MALGRHAGTRSTANPTVADDTATAPVATTDGSTRLRDGDVRDRDGVAERTPTVSEAVARQRADYGGIKWGSAFFGWLTAIGLAALLTAAISAAGAAIGLTRNDVNANDVNTTGQ